MRQVLAVLGLIFLVCFAGAAQCTPEVENNDTLGLADGLGSLSGGQCRSGVLDSPGDVDFFWFDLQSTGSVTITLQCWDDIFMTLSDGQGRWINGDSHIGGQAATQLTTRLAAGRYFVQLEAAYGGIAGRYEISATLNAAAKPSDCTPEVENNDSFGYADALCTEGNVCCRTGAISPGNDVDVYWFELSSSATVSIETVTAGDTMLYLYDASSNALAEDDDGGEGSASRLTTSLASGRYYVAVVSYGRDLIISRYEIYLSIAGSDGSADSDGNGPSPIEDNGSATGDAPPWGWWIYGGGILLNAWGSIDQDCVSDYDFAHGLCDRETFSFTVPSDGYIAVALIDESEQWLRAEVLDAFGYHIVAREGPQSSIYSQWAWVTAGTYTVEVTPGKRLDRSAFELHVFYSASEPHGDYLKTQYGPEEQSL
ncbi:PPC domain-containing protein [Candidatus Bipolaricaulota bacterium]|nr:PPC domain-containing protein [Candidatus Bipolaricaulota bacterium]